MSLNKCEGILVISCDQVPPENIILQILGKEVLPNVIDFNNIKGYPWNFETKYYSAEVNLYALQNKENLNSEFVGTIKAIVFYFEDAKSTSFDDVKNWMPYLKNIDAEVQLLVCNNSVDGLEDHEKKIILNWCVQNQYELIELNPKSESDDEDQCTIKDVIGYERVIQSLQSYTWANLIMKDEKPKIEVIEKENRAVEFNETSDLASNSKAIKSEDVSCVENSTNTTINNKDLELEDQWLTNVLNGEDPGGESFECLFTKFASLKDKASGLSGEERKKYAEKVAVAFWRAMGGDEDEIDGLDDD